VHRLGKVDAALPRCVAALGTFAIALCGVVDAGMDAALRLVDSVDERVRLIAVAGCLTNV
jgi:hypothetical protein